MEMDSTATARGVSTCNQAVQAAKELCDVCNLFGYGEIKPAGSAYYSGSMIEIFQKVERDYGGW